MDRQKILFYGDSNTYGYDPAGMSGGRYPADVRWTDILKSRLGDRLDVIAEGLNGRKLPNLRYNRERLLVYSRLLQEQDIFAIMLGTNDLLMTVSPHASAAIKRMDEFLHFMTGERAADRILVIAPPYVAGDLVRDPLFQWYYEESRIMNQGFGELAASYGTLFADASSWDIDLCFDHVHFSEDGHRKFAEKMEEYLLPRLTTKNAE